MILRFICALIYMTIFVPIGMVRQLFQLSRFEKKAYLTLSTWDFPLKNCAVMEKHYVHTK